MWLLLLLLAGLGLPSPLPRADSADLVLVAGDGEMSDIMRAAMTMMEDRADRGVELELKTPRSRSFSRRIKRRPSISRSLTVSSSSSEASQRPRVQFVQRRVDTGLNSQHLPRAQRQRSTTTPRTVDMRSMTIRRRRRFNATSTGLASRRSFTSHPLVSSRRLLKIRPNRVRQNSIVDSDNEKKQESEVITETFDKLEEGITEIVTIPVIQNTEEPKSPEPVMIKYDEEKDLDLEEEAENLDDAGTAGATSDQEVNSKVINVVQSDNNNGDTLANESDEGSEAEIQTSGDIATSPNSLIVSPESADNLPSSDQEDSQKPTAPAEGLDHSSENLEPFEELGEVTHQIENQIGDKTEHVVTEPNNSQDFAATDDIELSEYYFDENFDSYLTEEEDKLSEEYTLLEADGNLRVFDHIDDVTNRSAEEEETTIGPLILSSGDSFISTSTR